MIIDRARNRARILTLILLATLNYCIAAVIAATVTGVLIVIWILAHADGLPDSLDELKWIGIGAGVIVAVSAVVGGVIAVVRIPTLRRGLEARVMSDTGATIVDPDTLPRVRNLLDGLAIAAGIPAPRFCVIDDPALNSFGVGTKPESTIIGVTTGLIDTLPATSSKRSSPTRSLASRAGTWPWRVGLPRSRAARSRPSPRTRPPSSARPRAG